MLHFPDGAPFSHGACHYLYRPTTEHETSARIFVPIEIEGRPTVAAVDTGGVYLVCNPEFADQIDFVPNERLEGQRLIIRGIDYHGDIYRTNLTVVAEEGRGAMVEATVFVPRLRPGQRWSWPSFMGLQGCLERFRFAVDPETETFYFSSPSYE